MLRDAVRRRPARFDSKVAADDLEEPISTRLLTQIPPQGAITYVHVVEPGPPRPVEQLRVRVIGNAFSGYDVRFIRRVPASKAPGVCPAPPAAAKRRIL